MQRTVLTEKSEVSALARQLLDGFDFSTRVCQQEGKYSEKGLWTNGAAGCIIIAVGLDYKDGTKGGMLLHYCPSSWIAEAREFRKLLINNMKGGIARHRVIIMVAADILYSPIALPGEIGCGLRGTIKSFLADKSVGSVELVPYSTVTKGDFGMSVRLNIAEGTWETDQHGRHRLF